MNWKRERPGVYTAGPYQVKQSDLSAKFWVATGPDVEQSHHETKADAQAEAQRVATLRAADPDANAPVVGDIVEIIDQVAAPRRGQVSSIMLPDYASVHPHRQRPLYCVKLARGKRLCLFRHEIKVVVP